MSVRTCFFYGIRNFWLFLVSYSSQELLKGNLNTSPRTCSSNYLRISIIRAKCFVHVSMNLNLDIYKNSWSHRNSLFEVFERNISTKFYGWFPMTITIRFFVRLNETNYVEIIASHSTFLFKIKGFIAIWYMAIFISRIHLIPAYAIRTSHVLTFSRL